MAMDRRQFLRTAGIGALGLAGLPASRLLAGSDPRFLPPAEGLQADRWAMVIDLTMKASDEESIRGCHKVHNVPHHKNRNHEIKWLWNTPFTHAFPELASDHMVAKYKAAKGGNGHGETPSRVGRQALVLCNHCENPPCVRACPTKATFKRKDGIVLMDFHRCIGCRFCMAACPYGSRSFNFSDPRRYLDINNLPNPDYPTRALGVVEKCNFCAERLALGKIPACVEACKAKALIFGDLDDPYSSVREAMRAKHAIRRKTALGTGPGVYYIV